MLNALVYKKLPYDVMRDFIPVTNIGNSGGYLMLVSPALGVNNLKEFIAAAEEQVESHNCMKRHYSKNPLLKMFINDINEQFLKVLAYLNLYLTFYYS